MQNKIKATSSGKLISLDDGDTDEMLFFQEVFGFQYVRLEKRVTRFYLLYGVFHVTNMKSNHGDQVTDFSKRYAIGLTMLQQDLHIHSTYSTSDNAVVPQQTVALVAAIKHAIIVGISDHFECLVNGGFESYEKEIRQLGVKVGVEVDGHPWVDEATKYDVDYYIFHCRDQNADYRSLDKLLTTSKPVIIAHPNALHTDLNQVPSECLIELNNRYIWRTDWKQYYGPFTNQFKFVIGSDAHQPNWLSQTVAHYAAAQLGIEEHLVF